jgi:hypothetical protein
MTRVVLLTLLFVSTVHGFFFQSRGEVKPKPLLQDLAILIEKSKNGLEEAYGDDIKSLMTEISSSRVGDQRKSLPGKWELVYTTEKEVNFFKTSWPFAQLSSISQDLDVFEGGIVANSIDFEGGGQFAVSGAVDAVEGDSEYDRIAFEFKNAVVRGWGKELSLPPIGAGWFDTMYCDSDYRLSQDSRGDWSIFRRI